MIEDRARDPVVAGLEQNWRSTFTRLATSIEGAGVRSMDQGVLVKTGLPIGFFNIAFVDHEVSAPDDVVRQASEYFAPLPFTILVAEGQDDLAAACEAAGLASVDVLPGMALTPIPRRPIPASIRIGSVSPDMLATYAGLFSESYGLPPALAQRLFTDRYVEIPDSENLIAFVGEEPVAIGTVFWSGGFGGIYNVGTVEQHRGKGYGEAVTWAAIQRAREHGCDAAVLQSSGMGFSVYQRMGFEVVQRYRCFAIDS